MLGEIFLPRFFQLYQRGEKRLGNLVHFVWKKRVRVYSREGAYFPNRGEVYAMHDNGKTFPLSREMGVRGSHSELLRGFGKRGGRSRRGGPFSFQTAHNTTHEGGGGRRAKKAEIWFAVFQRGCAVRYKAEREGGYRKWFEAELISGESGSGKRNSTPRFDLTPWKDFSSHDSGAALSYFIAERGRGRKGREKSKTKPTSCMLIFPLTGKRQNSPREVRKKTFSVAYNTKFYAIFFKYIVNFTYRRLCLPFAGMALTLSSPSRWRGPWKWTGIFFLKKKSENTYEFPAYYYLANRSSDHLDSASSMAGEQQLGWPGEGQSSSEESAKGKKKQLKPTIEGRNEFSKIFKHWPSLLVIHGQAGGQGYEPNSPKPPDPIVVTYELYVVAPPSPQNSRGRCQLCRKSTKIYSHTRVFFWGGKLDYVREEQNIGQQKGWSASARG